MTNNYIYPLPPARLHARYDALFSALNHGQSVTLIGLPLSARSGYLKFILEYDPQFLSEFTDPATHHFLVIEDSRLNTDQLIHFLAGKFALFPHLSLSQKSLLESRLRIHDPQLTFLALQEIIKNSGKHKYTIILYEVEKLLDSQPASIHLLSQLWNTCRSQPDCLVTLCFIGSPILLEKKLAPHWSVLRPALEEQTIYFPLFNTQEMTYLKSRLEYFSGQKIPSSIAKLAIRLSGGHTVLFRLLTHLSETELLQLTISHSHPSIDALLAEIWSSLSLLDRQNYSSSSWQLPLLPPFSIQQEPSSPLPRLTAQQKILFDYLSGRAGQIIPRDEIAQVLWGKIWQTKYSDWAIDRAISKLRQKLSGSPYHLLTLKNRGFQFQS